MKRLLINLLSVGIKAQDDFFQRTLKIVVNLLLYNAIVMMAIVIALGLLLEENAQVLYLLLSFPLYAFVFYLNHRGKTALGFTTMFTIGTVTLTVASLYSGEESYTHIFFAAIIICISVLYRKGEYRKFYVANVVFTSLCFAFVVLSFHNNWFIWFEDSNNSPAYDRKLNVILLFISVVVFSLILVISTGRQHNRLFQMNRQNEILLAELNHRVKNNLAIITSLIRLKRAELVNEECEILIDLESRIKSIALMHDNMYSRNNHQQVKLKDFLNRLLESICHTYEQGKRIRIEQQVQDVELTFEQALPFSMIVNELVINSIKHAFNNVEAPAIMLICNREQDYLSLEYTDNGAGIDPTNAPKKGLGRELIDSLSEQLDAQAEEFSGANYKFKLKFKVISSNQ